MTAEARPPHEDLPHEAPGGPGDTAQPVTPAVDNLVLEVDGASGSVDDLVARTERGLLVTCLWYIREVDPQTLLLTGLTRDGVYLVEGGEITGAVNNYRFNESPIDILDRFTDATFAYQGGGRGLPRDKLEALERWVQGGFQPDLTILFDLPPDTAGERRSSVRDPDRFESESDAFFMRTRAEYLRRVEEAPYRFAVIDSTKTIPQIQKQLEEIVSSL